MARLARAVIPDRPHYVTQRGMRLHEHTGQPLGDKPFVRRLEQLLGRRLLPGQPGRPRKDKRKAYGVPGERVPGEPHRKRVRVTAPHY